LANALELGENAPAFQGKTGAMGKAPFAYMIAFN
jgi:hypothetical protein